MTETETTVTNVLTGEQVPGIGQHSQESAQGVEVEPGHFSEDGGKVYEPLTPKMVQLKNVGDYFEGTYLGARETTYAGKSRQQFHFDTDVGRIFVWDSALLVSQLMGVEPGTKVGVVYAGDNKNSAPGQSAAKLVRVTRIVEAEA